MSPCKRCGATLPERAAYCMHCGAAVETPAASLGADAFVQPALIGGVALGLLSSLPIISLGNCLCCMWILGGGGLAAWLLDRNRPPGSAPLTYGDGAFVGVLSGLAGAVVATLVSIPTRLLAAETLSAQRQRVEEMLAQYPESEGPIRELLLALTSPDLTLVALLATLLMNIAVFALFAMIGGILFVGLFYKKDGSKGRVKPPPADSPGMN